MQKRDALQLLRGHIENEAGAQVVEEISIGHVRRHCSLYLSCF